MESNISYPYKALDGTITMSGGAVEYLVSEVRDYRFVLEGPKEYLVKLNLGFFSERHKAMVLDIAEVAYAVFKGLISVKDPRTSASLRLEDIFSKYSGRRTDWVKFTVLLDLRDRGRRAKAGFEPNSLLYVKGSEKVMVFVTEENSPIRAGRLLEWIKSALSKGYQPVLAVVDAHGDVTYYTMSAVRINELRGALGW